MAALNRNAVKLALPALFEAMADPKWQTKEAATRFLGFLANASPEQISVRGEERLPPVGAALALPPAPPPPPPAPPLTPPTAPLPAPLACH